MARTRSWIHIDAKRLTYGELVKKYGRNQADMAQAMANNDIDRMVEIVSRPPSQVAGPMRHNQQRDHLRPNRYAHPYRMLRYPKKLDALDNPRIVTAAVGSDVTNLKFASDYRLCEREQLKQALRKDGRGIVYLNPALEGAENMETLAICAAQNNPFILRDLRIMIRLDELSTAAAEGLNLPRDPPFAATRLPERVVLAAVKAHGLPALRFSDTCFQEDMRMLTHAVQAKNPDNNRLPMQCCPLHPFTLLNNPRYALEVKELIGQRYDPLYDVNFKPIDSITCLSKKSYTMIANDPFLMGWLTLNRRQHRNRRAVEALLASVWCPARQRLAAKIDLWLIKNNHQDLMSAKRMATRCI